MADAAPSASSATAKYEERIKRLRDLHAKRVSRIEQPFHDVTFSQRGFSKDSGALNSLLFFIYVDNFDFSIIECIF